MFAVIATGGKQYKVSEGSVIKIEKIDDEVGNEVQFDKVLLIGSDGHTTQIGTPFVKGAVVTAEILSQTRDPKIIVFKKIRRQNYRRKNGHRQNVTHVKVKNIIKE